MKHLLYAVAAVCAVHAANAEWNLSVGSGWRIVGGAAYGSGLKTRLGARTARALSGLPSARSSGGVTREQAEAAVKALESGGRVDFDGGYIDPDYSGREELPDYTWNWRAPAGAYRDGAMNFEYGYSYVSSVAEYEDLGSRGSDRDLPGFTLELQRNVGQWGRFGFDAALGFSYYRRNDVFKASGTVYRRVDTARSGAYVASADVDPGFADWARNGDGGYGGGTYDGPGALLPIGGSLRYADVPGGSSRSETSAALDMRGDYEEIEFAFSLKPYFDLTDWLRAVGTIGVVVSRGKFDFDVCANYAGASSYCDRQRFDQWDVYGICGLGAMLHHEGACLGFDFLARFLDGDFDIYGRCVEGSISRPNWMFRLYFGYEF